MDTKSDFQTHLIAWLESCCQGEYYNSTHDEVVAQVESIQQLPEYKNPTETMPSPPPSICTIPEPHEKCKACANFCTWWGYFTQTVDDLLSKSNVHTCNRNKNKDGSVDKKHTYTGCMDNKWGKCKARFPRPLFQETQIDKDTGYLSLKKKEPWLNMFTPAFSAVIQMLQVFHQGLQLKL
jgi:hypothetical protein